MNIRTHELMDKFILLLTYKTSCLLPGAPNNPPVAGAGAPKIDVVGAGVGAIEVINRQ